MSTVIKKCSIMLMIAVMVLTFMPFVPHNQVMAASGKPAKVKITKAEYAGNSLYVTWKKTKGAKKYQIYVKVGKSKKFKKWATVKKPQTYRIKNLKWKTKYQVKMRAVNGKKTGAWSKVYQHKFGKKQTFESICKKNKKVSRALKEIEEAYNATEAGDIYNIEIKPSKNTLILSFTFKDPASDDYDADEAKAAFKKEFETAEIKKEMSKTNKDLEFASGLNDVKTKVIIKRHNGGVLYQYTYK